MEAVLAAPEVEISHRSLTFLRDPIEGEPEFIAIFEEAKRLAQAEVEARRKEFERTVERLEALDFLRRRGNNYSYHAALQHILRENYGFEWFTLQQMNPHLIGIH